MNVLMHKDCNKNKILTTTSIQSSEHSKMVIMEDFQDPFLKEASTSTESDGRREQVTPLNFAKTMRRFNKRLMKV